MTELIKAASIARVTSKTGKFLGFLVKSNHTEDYYQVTCTKIDGKCEFFCNCKAGQFGKVECCHVKAVKELVAARKELAKQPVVEQEITPAQVAQTAMVQAATKATYDAWKHSVWNSTYVSTSNKAPAKATVKRAPQFANMPLNGNRGFSFLR